MTRALLAAWLALPLLVGTASAQQQGSAQCLQSGGCLTTTEVRAVPSCDLTELLAASRVLAQTTRVFITEPAGLATARQLRDYADEQESHELAYARWRRAVEACP